MDPFSRLPVSRSLMSLQNLSNERIPEQYVGSPPPPCLHKLRLFTLVVNTASMINDRMTHSLGRLHALIAPVTFFIVAIFLTSFLVGACYKGYGSQFLQAYALLMCGFMECVLAYTVFSQLIKYKMELYINLSLVLNGVLPLVNAFLLGIDVVVLLISGRTDIVIESENRT